MSENDVVDPKVVAELQAEVDDLAERLATAENALRETQDALAEFEVWYRLKIASRLALVEELQAELEEMRGRDSAAAQERAAEARRVADNLTPKERYKTLMKRIHPDKFTDEDLKAEAEELSKQLNAAWGKRDFDEIDRIEAEIERRFGEESTPKERFRILTALADRLRSQVDKPQQQIDSLRTGALWDLFARSEELKAEGRDLLDEQAADLDEVAAALREEMASFEDSDPA